MISMGTYVAYIASHSVGYQNPVFTAVASVLLVLLAGLWGLAAAGLASGADQIAIKLWNRQFPRIAARVLASLVAGAVGFYLLRSIFVEREVFAFFVVLALAVVLVVVLPSLRRRRDR